MNRDDQYNVTPGDPERVHVYEDQPTPVPGDDETDQIRADIERTRADMSETIDAIQERLNPTNLKEQAKETVREQFQEAKEAVREATIGRVENMMHNASDTVSETRSTIMDTIKQNPVPAALVGIGLGWLFMNRSSGSSQRRGRRIQVYDQRGYYDDRRLYDDRRGYYDAPRYYDDRRVYGSTGTMEQGRQAVSDAAGRVQERASDVAGRAQETASNVASSVSDTASTIANRAQQTASNLTDQAQHQAQRVEDRFQQTLSNNPLAVGAVAMALGTAVGLALPQTQRENQLMGEARDNLVSQAQDVAQDTMEKVQRVASDVAEETKQTAKERAQEEGLTS